MKIEFFKKIHFLSHWTANQIQRVIYSFSEKTFLRNQTVYLQGEDPAMVFIIKEGEFEAERQLIQHVETNN